MLSIQRYLTAIFLVMLALSASAPLAADGAKNIPVNLEIVQTQFRTEQDVNGDGEVAFALTSHYKGAPGRAQSTGFSEVGAPVDPGSCPADFIVPFALSLEMYEDTLVFQDLSTLFISGSGLFCFDFATFTGVLSADLQVVGGTGRFGAATGELYLDLPQIYGRYLQYAVAEGTLTGSVEVPAGE